MVRVDLRCDRAGVTEHKGAGIRKRVSTRTDCQYRMKLVMSKMKGNKWYVQMRNEEHNHELVPDNMESLASYRRYRRMQHGGPSMEASKDRYKRVAAGRPVKPNVPDPPKFHTPVTAAAQAQPKAPLHLAAQRGQDKMVALLLDKGADVNARDTTGQTPLHCAVDGRKMATITLLLDRGADLSHKDARGLSPLHLAVDKGWEEVVLCLIERGADPNV